MILKFDTNSMIKNVSYMFLCFLSKNYFFIHINTKNKANIELVLRNKIHNLFLNTSTYFQRWLLF